MIALRGLAFKRDTKLFRPEGFLNGDRMFRSSNGPIKIRYLDYLVVLQFHSDRLTDDA